MFFLLRIVFGFAVAFAIYSPNTLAAYIDTPGMSHFRADLAATHPTARLQNLIAESLRAVPSTGNRSKD
jgi:hypothetical protein